MKGKKIDFLFLSQENMIEAGVLDTHKCVEVMDKAFKLMEKGDYIMGGPSGNSHGMKLWFPLEPMWPHMPAYAPDRHFMSMMAYLGGEFNVCGQKWYGSNTENPEKYSLPRSILLLILNDPVTAEPFAIMDGNLISAMRTGAVVGLGAKYLAKKEAKVAGIIAAGVISRACLMALSVVLQSLKEVKVFDIIQSKAKLFSEEMSKKLDLDVHPVGSLEEAVRNSDAISTASSGAKHASFRAEWFKEQAFFAVSSEAELTADLWSTSRVVTDNSKMHAAWREEIRVLPDQLKGPILSSNHISIELGKLKDEDVEDLGKIALGVDEWKGNETKRVILVTGGMPIEDVAWGYSVYKQALAKGIGQKLTLWNEPYWY